MPATVPTADASLKESLRQARHDLYRDAVLEAAERVFADAGYESAKMQQIAREAGISLGTLYGVFEGKVAIFRAIHERRGRELMDAVSAVGTGDLVAYLWDGMGAWLSFMMTHPAYLRMHLSGGHAWTHHTARPSPEQDLLFGQGLELMATTLQLGIDEGLVFDEDPRLQAKVVMATHQVWLAEWVDGGMKDDPVAFIDRIRHHTLHVLSAAGAQPLVEATRERIARRPAELEERT